MEKVIFKVESTEKGVEAEVSGNYHKLVNALANALINEPEYVAILNDAIAVSFKELSRRNQDLIQQQKPKSKLIGLNDK